MGPADVVDSAATVFPVKVPLSRYISEMGGWFSVTDMARSRGGSIGQPRIVGSAIRMGGSAKSRVQKGCNDYLLSKNMSKSRN